MNSGIPLWQVAGYCVGLHLGPTLWGYAKRKDGINSYRVQQAHRTWGLKVTKNMYTKRRSGYGSLTFFLRNSSKVPYISPPLDSEFPHSHHWIVSEHKLKTYPDIHPTMGQGVHFTSIFHFLTHKLITSLECWHGCFGCWDKCVEIIALVAGISDTWHSVHSIAWLHHNGSWYHTFVFFCG